MQHQPPTTAFTIPDPHDTLSDEVEFLCVREPRVDEKGRLVSEQKKDRRLIVKFKCKSAANVKPEDQFRKVILLLFMHHPVKLLPKNTVPVLSADGHSCALARTYDKDSFLFLPKTRKDLEDKYFWDLRNTGNKGSNTEMYFQIETELNVSQITRHEETSTKFRANNFFLQHVRVQKCKKVRNVGVLVGVEPAMLDAPHLTQEVKHLLEHKFDIDCYSHYINMGVNLLKNGEVTHQQVEGQFIAVRTTDDPDQVFEALGRALMDNNKTTRTITAGLQLMPMGPTAGFEEAALVTGIYNHNQAVSKLASITIQQLFDIDKPFALSEQLQQKFRLATTNNERPLTTFRYLFIDAAHQCYGGTEGCPIKGLKKMVRGNMDVICDEAKMDDCAQFIDGFLEVMKEDLGEEELAKLVGVYDSTNYNKHPRRAGQYVQNAKGSAVLHALRTSIMGNTTFEGTVIIAPSPKKRAAAPHNHFRKAPNPASEHRSRAPDNNQRPTTYADMAKAANDIPTPKPVHKPRTITKSPESAQKITTTDKQIVPFTPQTQELTALTQSLSSLISSFEKVMDRQLTIEKRQENMESVLETRQQTIEKEQEEKNRRMNEKMESVTEQAEKQFAIMAQTNLDMQRSLSELTRNMTTMSQILSTNITTGNTTVTQMSDMTSTDQSMHLADMSGEKRKAADGTNHTQAGNFQVAPADGLSTEEESPAGAAGD
jgi:hypothetical protein